MIRIRHNLSRALTMISAVVCIVLAFLWPNWRDELRGQYYYYYYVTATAPGLSGSPLTFTATGLVPTAIAAVGGNDQSGIAGTALAQTFVVQVTDASSNPVPGVPVTFAVDLGGGTLSATSVTTNNRGEAATLLTLGPGIGTNNNTVTATASGVTDSVTFTASGQAP